MTWEIQFTNKAKKQSRKLKRSVLSALYLLIEDLTHLGPAISNTWPNYGKLKSSKNEDRRHCHLVKGRPTYVCCWEVINHKIKIIEVYYVGTHENAPY